MRISSIKIICDHCGRTAKARLYQEIDIRPFTFVGRESNNYGPVWGVPSKWLCDDGKYGGKPVDLCPSCAGEKATT